MIGQRYFSIIKLLLSVNKRIFHMFISIIFLMILESILSAFSIASLYPVLEVLLEGELTKSSNFFLEKVRELELNSDTIIKISLLIIIASSTTSLFRRYFQVFTAESLRTILHENLSNKIMSTDLGKIAHTKEGVLVENLSRNTDQCAMFLLKVLDQLFILFYTSFLFITLFIINYKIAVIFVLLIFISIPFAKKYLNLGTIIAQNKVILEKKITSIFVWLVNNLKEIFVLNLKNFFYTKISLESNNLKINRVKNKMYSFAAIPIFEILFSVTLLLIFIFFSDFSKIKDNLPFITTFFFITYKMLIQTINFFSKSFSTETILAAIASIKRDIGIDLKLEKPISSDHEPDEKRLFQKCIEFKKVKIRSSDHNILIKKSINLKIFPNSINLILGRSGSGKTSILDLLIKINKNYDGEILFDNISIAQINEKNLKKKIGYVTQNCSLFSDNIIENIVLENNFNKMKFKKIVKLCNIEKLILKSNSSNLIKQLSGGEIKRICLARALYKEPDLLIIDESLGSTDEKFESTFIENLKNQNITIILVSHRKSSIKNADKIYSLDK